MPSEQDMSLVMAGIKRRSIKKLNDPSNKARMQCRPGSNFSIFHEHGQVLVAVSAAAVDLNSLTSAS